MSLPVKAAFFSPAREIESSSHPAMQTDNIALTRAGKRTTQYVMATAKQTTANRSKDSVLIPANWNISGPDQP